MNPNEALDALAGETLPFLIGVRHHSPACAAAMPALLDAFAPTRLLIELPAEFTAFLSLLGDPSLEPPVALAAVRKDGSSLFFYPFAEFSPELAALRWAKARGVPVEAFDQPYLARGEANEDEPAREIGTLTRALCSNADVEDSAALWDVLVETRAVPDDPERTRRAALLFGWALRADARANGGISAHDLARERYMRGCLQRAQGERLAAVVGSFHASALTQTPLVGDVETAELSSSTPSNDDMVASLIPYSFDLLDARSGYPAGIVDPMWQARAYAALSTRQELEHPVLDCLTAIAHDLRERGHVASLPDIREALRLARDLARLRNLPGPGRRELVEAIETTMAHGERLGRGRVLARAMERVLVGNRRGRLPPGAPRSGLAPHVEALLSELKLPGPSDVAEDAKPLVLDPLRSDLDRKREITLARLCAAGVPYATREERASQTQAELLTTRWSLQYTPSTAAMLELCSLRGVTLAQAAEGSLRQSLRGDEHNDEPALNALQSATEQAAECALPTLLAELSLRLTNALSERGGLHEVVTTLFFFERLGHGHIPGAPAVATDDLEAFELPEAVRRSDLLAVAIRAVEGLAGSTRIEDVRALLELVGLMQRQQDEAGALGDGRLHAALQALKLEGSPLMQGAAGAALVLLGRDRAEDFATTLASHIDAAIDLPTSQALSQRLKGALTMALPLFDAHPGLVGALIERIDALPDTDFLRRLPALRDGFDVLSPAARSRLLAAFSSNDDPTASDWSLTMSPALLARHAEADQKGRAAVAALGLALTPLPLERPGVNSVQPARAVGHTLSLSDRLRLLFGRERERMAPTAARYAKALDELYGHGHGEGAGGGGREPAFPTVREWASELADLFGDSVRDEVLGRALSAGRPAAALSLDPDTISPSIELLEQVLSLKGGLAERDLAQLRKLVQRIVDALVQALAERVRPALVGLVSAQATRRPSGPLDLRRTVNANLRSLRRGEGGEALFVPEVLWFRRRAKRALDWHVILVVDVSGSMEPSVIYSAMMAAIFNGLPALSVRFVAFNTEVMDLSERVDDPLGLLLEVQIGGGTAIAKGLRYARSLVKVPARTIVLCISDFEEGDSLAELLSEVRALRESSVKLLGLAALDDRGAPRFQRSIAELLVEAGMPIAALSPLELARWVGEQIR
ncbi:MAG: DUF5682 family protein [Myxococcota bacterium]